MWWPALYGWSALIYGADPNPVLAVLAGGTGAAVVTAGGAYLISRRRESGSVRPSNAAELWSAYDKVMARVESDNAQLRERVASLERFERENETLRERVAVLEAEVDRLRGKVNGHE